ncbi:hypothetical protein LIER_30368 [Lithospermum erythrorhizon]|uniref:Reverse transcriptase domain-containing protein n=1 Tax=Lithospermum erythrorhizon TaxID=34254 RepID=A0AAV3RQG8_LITER
MPHNKSPGLDGFHAEFYQANWDIIGDTLSSTILDFLNPPLTLSKWLHPRFPQHWISLIKECISMVQFSVLVNGQTTTPFKPSCSLRQGDPLSPILFAICSEALSATLLAHQASNNLKGISVAKQGQKINHLLFADDSLFFIHLDLKSINSFCNTIKDFLRGLSTNN